MKPLFIAILCSCIVKFASSSNDSTSNITTARLEEIMDLFPNRSLALHEIVCHKVHNDIRKVHGLPPLEWGEFFVALADSRAIHLMYSNFPFVYSDLAKRYFKEDELSYVFESRNVQIYQNRRRRNIEDIVAVEISTSLRQWYLSGVFDPSNAGENYQAILDPRAISLGCVVRLVTLNSTMQKMYFVVAYRKMPLESYGVSVASGQTNFLTPLPNFSCFSSCGSTKKCLSHNIGLQNGFCSCAEDGSQRPVCLNTCYVNCHVAASGQQSACFGNTTCSCDVTGMAICL